MNRLPQMRAELKELRQQLRELQEKMNAAGSSQQEDGETR
jgi:uncharacterized coiled-coil protein SlyX